MATYYWVGGSGTWDNSSTANWSASSGGAAGSGPPNNADTAIFDANSGTAATVTVASTAVSLSTTVNKSDINLSLSGSPTLCTTAGTLTLTAGTITLGSNTLTAGRFSSSNANARTIAFGTGNITLTGNAATIWTTANKTNLTMTGTPVVNATYAGGTGTRTFSTPDGEAFSFDLNVTAGTDSLSILNYVKSLDLTGFAGNFPQSANIVFYGGIKLSTGTTLTGSGATFTFTNAAATSFNIDTAGKTLDVNLTANAVGGTYVLAGNVTTGSSRTLILSNGTINLANNTLTCGIFSSSASTARSIAFGTGSITLTGNAAGIFNHTNATNFTYTGTPNINLTYSGSTGTRTVLTPTSGATESNAMNYNVSAGSDIVSFQAASFLGNLNFSGFSGSWANTSNSLYGSLTLSSTMTVTAGTAAVSFIATSGTKTITSAGLTIDRPIIFNGIGGTFAFQDSLTQGATRAFTLTNGTLQLKNGVTSTVGAFATSGTNQKFLQSTSAGNQATISQASGSVDASYLTIQDSNATGGATWSAYVNQQNSDAGNNDGWDFGISPVVAAYEYTYSIRSFTQPKRF